MNIQDASSVVISPSISDFDANIVHGKLVPVWSSNAHFGYGAPSFQFLPPLKNYVLELFLLATGNLADAATSSLIFFGAVSMIGMALLVRFLVHHREPCKGIWPNTGSLVAGLAYCFCPLFFSSQIAVIALLPWVTLATGALITKPSRMRIAGSALAWSLLVLANPTSAIFALVLMLGVGVKERSVFKAIFWILGAVGLAGLLSAFFWWPAVFERIHVQMPVPDRTYSSLAIIGQKLGYIPGACALWMVWRWLGRSPAQSWKRGSARFWKGCTTLFGLGILCIMLAIRTPVLLEKAFQDFQPLPFCAFLGAVLSGLIWVRESQKLWQVIGNSVIVAGLAFLSLNHTHLRTMPETSHDPYPAQVVEIPLKKLYNELEFLGRGEGNCIKESPSSMECEVMVIKNSTVQFNLFDYPNWQAQVDGKPSDKAVNPRTGTLELNLTPGKHTIRWDLIDTPLRMWSKLVTFVGFLGLVFLLFQNQVFKTKPLTPKRRKDLEIGAFS